MDKKKQVGRYWQKKQLEDTDTKTNCIAWMHQQKVQKV